MESNQTVIQKAVIIIGPVMAGKTTLTARLAGNDSYLKTYATIGK